MYVPNTPGWSPDLPGYLFRVGRQEGLSYEDSLRPNKELCVAMSEAGVTVKDLIAYARKPKQSGLKHVADFLQSSSCP